MFFLARPLGGRGGRLCAHGDLRPKLRPDFEMQAHLQLQLQMFGIPSRRDNLPVPVPVPVPVPTTLLDVVCAFPPLSF